MTKIKVIICDVEQYDSDFPPEKAIDFLAWINKKLDEVPIELLNEAVVYVGTTYCGDDATAQIEISYERPETAEEERNRILRNSQAHARKMAEEKELLRRLQAKYGREGLI